MTIMTGDEARAGDISVTRHGAMARIELNRVRALNALTTAMRAEIASAVSAFSRDASLYIVAIRSSSAKAFSAGGDVRELVAWGKEDPARAKAALAAEYRLNWLLECFSKPVVSFIDGVVMGSGVGISLYNTHRVAGEGYRFAMPETAIGLFPDVGVAHALARLPNEIGTYLGLTGRTIGRAEAYHLGLATHCIAGNRFAEIETLLADAQPVDRILDGLHEAPGPGELQPYRSLIADCFAAETVEAISERLARATSSGHEFAAGVLADLAKRSPTSLKITLRHIRQSRQMDLREVLTVDYRLACRCIDGHDFAEGVRAALIDKDNLPVWWPARISDVTEAMVAAHFAAGPGLELDLPTRAEMQALRA